MKTKMILILVAAILLTACGPKTGPTPAGTLPPINSETPDQALSGNVDVKIASFAFDPPTLTIQAGTTVTWTNEDSAAHTVVADDNSFSSKNLSKGDTFSFTFAQAGTYTYRCGIHASMKGTITVVP